MHHKTYDKSNWNYVKKTFPSIVTINNDFFMKTINIYDVNYKLNAYEDILLLPSFDKNSSNADKFYNRSSVLVMHTNRPYVMFNVLVIYMLNF